MRKASQILYLVGGIIAIVCAVAFVIVGGVYVGIGAAGAANKDLVIEYIKQTQPGIEITEELVIATCATLIATGVWFLIEVPFAALSAVFAFKARKEGTKKLAILNIVFGVLGVTIVPVVGAIFNLIANSQEGQ